VELADTLSSNGSSCGFDSHRAHHPRRVAQLVEQEPLKLLVARSNRALSATTRGSRGIGVMVAQESPNLPC
jgi:hypothetical protein